MGFTTHFICITNYINFHGSFDNPDKQEDRKNELIKKDNLVGNNHNPDHVNKPIATV